MLFSILYRYYTTTLRIVKLLYNAILTAKRGLCYYGHMRETNKSRKAFEDYFNLGPGRSIHKLHALYQSRPEARPTRHVSTLKSWSTAHGWQKRVQQRDLEIAEATLENMKDLATRTGYAVFQQRVYDLNALAQRLYTLLSVGPLQAGALQAYRGLLADIAAEMGERKQILRIEDWREELRKHDVEPSRIFEEMVKQFMDVQSDSTD